MRLVFRDDHAEVEDAALRIRIVPDASSFRENLVELDSHGPALVNVEGAMKREAVVLGCDT